MYLFTAYFYTKEDYLMKYLPTICTLSYCSKIEVNITAPPGCAILTISDKCEVHLLLKEFIDPAKELEKVLKKQEQLKESKTKLIKIISAEDYTDKVPQTIQEANNIKITQLNVEIIRLEEAIKTLKLME